MHLISASHTSETPLIGKMEKERFLGFFYPFVSIISLLSCFALFPSFSGEIGHSSDGVSDLVHDFRSKRKYFYMIYLLRRMGERKRFPIVRRVVHFRII